MLSNVFPVIQNGPVPLRMAGSVRNCSDKFNNINNISANNTIININTIYCSTNSGFCKNRAIHNVGRAWKYISLIIVADGYIWYTPHAVWIMCIQLTINLTPTCIMSIVAEPSVMNVALGDQAGLPTSNLDQAPPLGTTSLVMNEVGDDNANDDSSLPDLKGIGQALLNGLDPGADLEDTRGLREYLSSHPFPDESGGWNTVSTDQWLKFLLVSVL